MSILRRVSSLAVCSTLLFGSVASALEPPKLENNPFARPQISTLSAPGDSTRTRLPSGDGLQLTATMVSGETRFANVNGRITRVGDRIADYEVKEIFEDRVLFIRNDLEVVIFVKPQLDENNEQSVANR